MENPIMFVLQGGLAIIMLFFGFILNGMRQSIQEVNADLKALNNSVLGKYITREESDSRWKDQRVLDHELRALISVLQIELAEAKHTFPFNDKPQ